MGRLTEKVTQVIVWLTNAHEFAHSSLEDREVMVPWPE
jgi:hypothetical protein